MNDDKRLLRKLKKQVKRTGNKKRRRYLKDVAAEPGSFEFGADRSDLMNEKPQETDRQAPIYVVISLRERTLLRDFRSERRPCN